MTTKPLYPYDKRTEKITLPPEIEQEIHQLVQSGRKVEAVQRVLHLTEAGLRISKDYVDVFERENKP
jgi:hypothetical protein